MNDAISNFTPRASASFRYASQARRPRQFSNKTARTANNTMPTTKAATPQTSLFNQTFHRARGFAAVPSLSMGIGIYLGKQTHPNTNSPRNKQGAPWTQMATISTSSKVYGILKPSVPPLRSANEIRKASRPKTAHRICGFRNLDGGGLGYLCRAFRIEGQVRLVSISETNQPRRPS